MFYHTAPKKFAYRPSRLLAILVPLFFQYFLLPQASVSQTWSWQNPLPTGIAFTAVACLDSNHAAIVGESGTILLTTNRGNSWALQTSNTTQPFRGVSYFAPNKVCAVGDSGVILLTTNGGVNWTSIVSQTFNRLWSVSFTDSSNGWVAGNSGTILQTTNGGTIWEAQSSGVTVNLTCIKFADIETGFATGQSTISGASSYLRTTNGGWTWTSGNIWGANARLSFIDGSMGWIMGRWANNSMGFMYTNDGGLNYTIQRNTGISTLLNEFVFISLDTGWAVGANGAIMCSTDTGSTWTNQNSGTAHTLESVVFSDELHGWAVGQYGTILHTNNGGVTWTSQTTGALNVITNISFPSQGHGWVVGSEGLVLQTTNNGESWINRFSGTTRFRAVAFSNTNNGWIVGDSGKILRTTDGGSSWNLQTTGRDYYGITFADSMNGWMIDYATIYRTTNGGVTWSNQFFDSTTLRSIAFYDNLNGIAVGSYFGAGIQWCFMRTTDGGVTWSRQIPLQGNVLYDVAFADSNNIWAVGDFSTILHSTDRGVTWSPLFYGGHWDFYSVSFISTTEGWVIGLTWEDGCGLIWHTTNGGMSWTNETMGTIPALLKVRFFNNNEGWIVGGGGTILHYTGTTWVPDPTFSRLPSTVSLRQNYPNPFNSSTTIEYSLPHNSSTKLELFDLLGRNVRTLVNTSQNPGTYRIHFDATNLSSGEYFYRLSTNNFTETRKMMYIK